MVRRTLDWHPTRPNAAAFIFGELVGQAKRDLGIPANITTPSGVDGSFDGVELLLAKPGPSPARARVESDGIPRHRSYEQRISPRTCCRPEGLSEPPVGLEPTTCSLRRRRPIPHNALASTGRATRRTQRTGRPGRMRGWIPRRIPDRPSLVEVLVRPYQASVGGHLVRVARHASATSSKPHSFSPSSNTAGSPEVGEISSLYDQGSTRAAQRSDSGPMPGQWGCPRIDVRWSRPPSSSVEPEMRTS